MTFYGPLPLSAIEQKQPFICKSFLIFGDFAPKCSDPPFLPFCRYFNFSLQGKVSLLIFFCGLFILAPESISREEDLFENRISGNQGRQSTEAAFATHIQPSWVQMSDSQKLLQTRVFKRSFKKKWQQAISGTSAATFKFKEHNHSSER